MIKEKDNDFILILFDIGKNPEGSEYSFRIMEVIIELPLFGFFLKILRVRKRFFRRN
jgi:hypothetical protein